MKHLKNLSSHALFEGVAPWEYVPSPPIPDAVRADKQKRDIWINSPSTQHFVYSGNVGVNENQRITKPKGDGEGNPIHSTHYLVGDYDSAQPEEIVLRHAKNLPYPPNYIERTLSGNARFIWLLEEPLKFPSFDFAKHFFKQFAEFAFDPSRGMIGFDRPAWEAPERYYTNSGDWQPVTDKRIPADVSRGWLVKASERFDFASPEFGPTIPLEDLTAELVKKYPRFSEWPSDFVLGSQGPTFWVEASASPKSAIVRETGLQTFSAHAHKSFFAWADLLGITFVKSYQSVALGRAVEDMHHDGRHYYSILPNGKWRAKDKHDTRDYLKTGRNISIKPDKRGSSDVDRAMNYIRQQKAVDGVGPFIYRKEGVIELEEHNNSLVLNTSKVRVMPPAEGVAIWGDGGQLPGLSRYISHLLVTEKQLNTFMSWAHWLYKGAYELKPKSGQSLFIAGPPNVGKSLFSRGIIAPLFGGYMDASAALLSGTTFNRELFDKPIWAIDDDAVSANTKEHTKWTALVKKTSANDTHTVSEKFKTGGQIKWQGRLVVTFNVDPESVQMMPDLVNSIRDKVIGFRTTDRHFEEWPDRTVTEAMVARELPWLARYILDWVIPEDCLGDLGRFGVKAYIEPSLELTVKQSSKEAAFNEALSHWKKEYPKENPKEDKWEGTALELHMAFVSDPRLAISLRGLTPDKVGRQLMTLKDRGANLKYHDDEVNGTRIWTIFLGKPSTSKETKTVSDCSNQGAIPCLSPTVAGEKNRFAKCYAGDLPSRDELLEAGRHAPPAVNLSENTKSHTTSVSN